MSALPAWRPCRASLPRLALEAVAQLHHELVVVRELPHQRVARAADGEVAEAEPEIVAQEIGDAREREPPVALRHGEGAAELELEALAEEVLAQDADEPGLGVLQDERRRALGRDELVHLHERLPAV